MANEVLRATSDDSRGSRKRKRHQAEVGDSPGDAADREDADEEQNEDVRFSEDVTDLGQPPLAPQVSSAAED